MTDETPDDGYAKWKAANEAFWAAHPIELAEINARSDAMHARAEVYERALADQITALKALVETEDGGRIFAGIVCVIVLEKLRCAALGCSEPSWQEALQRNRVITRRTIETVKPKFQQEAMN